MSKKIAILIHGFYNTPESMNEIENFIRTDPVLKKIYVDIWNISYYDSKRGLDQTRPHNIFTPIYQHNDPHDDSLAKKAFQEIKDMANSLNDEDISLDLIGHSLGGLVIRCLVQYFTEKKDNHIFLANFPINNLILLGTANKGSQIASKLAKTTLPLQIAINSFKLLYDLADGEIEEDDLFNFHSYQFHQFSWNSSWIKQINKDFKPFKHLNWITVRGITKGNLLYDLWNGWTLWRINFRKDFPFIHIGPLPNDGLIEARSVPLPGAKNFTVKNCSHHELIKWESSPCGKKVAQILVKFLQK